LTLESTAGRYGTILIALDPSFPVITIAQAKVRIGKKGKGFTLRGSDEQGVLVDDPGFPNLKIEGNQATQNGAGFSLQGDKIQVRYNIARANEDEGIECSACTSANIQFNESVGNGSSGLHVVGDVTKALVRNNKNVANFDGIYVSTDMGTEKVTIKDNVMENNKGAGLYLRGLTAGTIQSNIVTRYVRVGDSDYEHGMEIEELDDTKVRYNVVLGSEINGFLMNSSTAMRIEGNTVALSVAPGIKESGGDFELFKNNNTYRNDGLAGNCGIDTEVVDFVYTKHFFAGDDIACVSGSGTIDEDGISTVDKPYKVKVNKARAL
jgi:parallel beta-helix repeat protein